MVRLGAADGSEQGGTACRCIEDPCPCACHLPSSPGPHPTPHDAYPLPNYRVEPTKGYRFLTPPPKRRP